MHVHRYRGAACLLVILTILACLCRTALGAEAKGVEDGFPRALTSYSQPAEDTLLSVLRARVAEEPFNLVGTIIFLLAIIHTFLAPFFLRLAHRAEKAHCARLEARGQPLEPAAPGEKPEVSFWAEILHFLGEVEAIFGIWVVPLLLAITWAKGWGAATNYLNHDVSFTEPIFVVVIMSMAASRPVLKFSERVLARFAGLLGGGPAGWWLSILTIGPVLGSFITEPAAMTICALLLAEKVYERQPSNGLAYATLGLLFVNVSVGGTLTHFAAPPVLMVAGKWGWGMSHMMLAFGWKAVVGIIVANIAYFWRFRAELRTLGPPRPPVDVEMVHWDRREEETVPVWLVVVHLAFLGWTVWNNHYPVLFVGGFLFYLAFTQATQHHQFELSLRPPLLVGFFLAGLVVHGGLQGWWIEPVLTRLTSVPLFFGAVGLTAFNDNAAITYLASLVPGFSAELKYAVVAGAVVGGGLTVIANAPNPAGQSILSQYFPDGISPLKLFFGAAVPTAIMCLVFLVFRF